MDSILPNSRANEREQARANYFNDQGTEQEKTIRKNRPKFEKSNFEK